MMEKQILKIFMHPCFASNKIREDKAKRQVGGQSKTQLVSYIKDVYSKIRSKTTCFGLIWPPSGFSFPLRFRYINCDVEISHPIIILVCLYIGGYYITLIYIYIYILSLLVGVGFHPGDVSWMSTSSSSGGCCHEAVNGWPSGNGLTCVEVSLCVSNLMMAI